MIRVLSSQLSAHLNEPVLTAGWLHHFRRLRHICFLILRDSQGLIQVVIEDNDLATCLEKLNHESVQPVEHHRLPTGQRSLVDVIPGRLVPAGWQRLALQPIEQTHGSAFPGMSPDRCLR